MLLGFSALLLLGYGAVSFFAPTVPADIAGLVMNDGNAYAEVGGMYGGLQSAIGLFCLIALLRQDYYRPGLALLGLTMGFLAMARLFSAWMTAAAITTYTYGALAFEFVTAALALLAFLSTSNDSA
ncbi:MAG: DUF4345 family protein [Pseudomonadota bacterium]|nr:DUF4345 family protein [Pseudomonadota bacterium]